MTWPCHRSYNNAEHKEGRQRIGRRRWLLGVSSTTPAEGEGGEIKSQPDGRLYRICVSGRLGAASLAENLSGRHDAGSGARRRRFFAARTKNARIIRLFVPRARRAHLAKSYHRFVMGSLRRRTGPDELAPVAFGAQQHR